MEGNWYLLYVRNNCENAVKASLDVEAFVPACEKVENRNGNRYVKMVPKFPNYVYVRHDGSRDFFARVSANDKVIRFVGQKSSQEDPPSVESPLVLDNTLKSARAFISPGDRVEVINGQYEGMKGSVRRKSEDNNDEFIVVIPILGRLVTEVIRRDCLRLLED